jgi:hypothetical protein
MTARSAGKAHRAPECHATPPPSLDQLTVLGLQDAGETFDIAGYVRASRSSQQLPATVSDPAVLERLVALLRVAVLEQPQTEPQE